MFKYLSPVLLLGLLFSCSQPSEYTQVTEPSEPVKLIFDTDFGGDADDLGALAMLNHFENAGEAELLAVMGWNLEEYSVRAIDAVNTYYGNPDIPIGRRSGEAEEIPWNHSKPIADVLPHDVTVENAPEATALYREILAENEDTSIVIVTVKQNTNPVQRVDFLC